MRGHVSKCFVAYTNSPANVLWRSYRPVTGNGELWLFRSIVKLTMKTSGLLSVTPEKMIEANGYVSAGGINLREQTGIL